MCLENDIFLNGKIRLMQKDIKVSRKSISLLFKLLLAIWIVILFSLQVVLYPPTPLLRLIDTVGASDSFTSLQRRLTPFFQTSDLNLDFAIKFND